MNAQPAAPTSASCALPPAKGGEPTKILDIERLRGVSILMVLFVHIDLSFAIWKWAGLEVHRAPFWLAVEMFFVISGFVVTKSFLSKRMSFRAFYLRRVFRLWPVILVYFGVVSLVNLPITPDKTAWGVLARLAPSILFGYFTFLDDTHVQYAGAMWSLSVEEQFYLFAPALLFLCVRLSRNPERACRRLFLGFYLLVAIAVRFTLMFGDNWPVPVRAWVPAWIVYLDFKKFDFLALGVLLYFQMPRLKRLGTLSGWVLRPLMLLALTTPFALAYVLKVSPSWGECRHLLTFGMLAAGLCFYLVVGLAAQDRDLLRFGGLLDRGLLYFGSRSYGLYVLHFPLFMVPYLVIYHLMPRLFGNELSYGAVHAALFLALGLPVVELSYRFVEKPAIRLGGHLAARLLNAAPTVREDEVAPAHDHRRAA